MRRVSLWVAGVVLAIGLSAQAGTIGTVSDPINAENDVFAMLVELHTIDYFSGEITGVTDLGNLLATFTLSSTDPTQVVGTLDVMGTTAGIPPAPGKVADYHGILDVLDLSAYSTDNTIKARFLSDGSTIGGVAIPDGTPIIAFVDLNSGLADISANPVTVPTPGALAGGLLLAGLISIRAVRRFR